jgi:hypothetical protein
MASIKQEEVDETVHLILLDYLLFFPDFFFA